MWGVGVVLHGHNNHVHAFSVVLESRSARHAFAALIDVSVCGKGLAWCLHDASPIHEVFLLFF